MESRAFTALGEKIELITMGNGSYACLLNASEALRKGAPLALQKKVEEILNVKILSISIVPTDYFIGLAYSQIDMAVIYFVHEPKQAIHAPPEALPTNPLDRYGFVDEKHA